MVRPDLETFRTLARSGSAVPLVREVLADLDTALEQWKREGGIEAIIDRWIPVRVTIH